LNPYLKKGLKMPHNDWIPPLISGLGYLGDVVFAISGALAAGRHRMDTIGFMIVGTITAIGGGTIRDLLLGREVFWITNQGELGLCLATSLLTYFLVPEATARKKAMVWSDALGLSAFAVSGAQIALNEGAQPLVAIVMGMITGTGGGLIRDLICGEQPFITRGELYASTALAGAATCTGLAWWGITVPVSMLLGFLVVLGLRAWAILFNVRMGPPGEFIRIGREPKD
jgi:uncharacterized membrane protein YeiH